MATKHSAGGRPPSFLLPIMAAAVAAGLVRMVLRKRSDDRVAADRAERAAERAAAAHLQSVQREGPGA